MTAWQPTPEPDLFLIRRYELSRSDWLPCEFESLKAGDIFAAFSQDGEQVDPSTGEAWDGEKWCARATADAYKNAASGQGYQVPVEFGLLEDLLSGKLN